ncbi:MAG: hypothetical protein HC932_01170 [Thermales bacterium]|nr:hypothetical protein [Thermales bacterium]
MSQELYLDSGLSFSHSLLLLLFFDISSRESMGMLKNIQLGLTHQEFMKQRIKEKRDKIFGIFIGFTHTENKKDLDNFLIDKM